MPKKADKAVPQFYLRLRSEGVNQVAGEDASAEEVLCKRVNSGRVAPPMHDFQGLLCTLDETRDRLQVFRRM